MAKITTDGLTQSGTGGMLYSYYPYGNSGRQRVNNTWTTTKINIPEVNYLLSEWYEYQANNYLHHAYASSIWYKWCEI